MKKSNSFKFDTTHALILLSILFISSLVYLFLSRGGGSGRFEYFSEPAKYSIEYYYIEGCPHCVDFDPVWKKVSANAEFAGKVDFKKYEISTSDRASKFKIRSAPTIIAVEKSSDSKVADAPSRDAQGFSTFVKKYM